MPTERIVQQFWNYCNVLRDDGMSYGGYVEQLTHLLFLRMADERSKAPHNQKSPVPEQYGWRSLVKKDGDELFDHYRHTLEALGNQKGLLGLIFNKSQNKFQDPTKPRRLAVGLIDKEEWVSMSADVKGDAYEGLLDAAPRLGHPASLYLLHPWSRAHPCAHGVRTSSPSKNAQGTKAGAGQYSARASCFALPPPSRESCAPRPLIQATVGVTAAKPGETVSHPACGTGGFLLAAHDYVVKHNPRSSMTC